MGCWSCGGGLTTSLQSFVTIKKTKLKWMEGRLDGR